MPETTFQMKMSEDLRQKLDLLAMGTERDASKFVRWLIQREWDRQQEQPAPAQVQDDHVN